MTVTPSSTDESAPDAQLGLGDTAPDFTLEDADGNQVTLSDLRGGKVILYFYPEAMTSGCTTEACDFTAARGSLDTGGYTVLGVSRDAPSKLQKFRTKERLDLTLLSDPDRAVHDLYGAWGEKTLYGKTMIGVIRSTFVIDENGVITQAYRNVKATGHVERVLRELGLAA
jgi:thioredoxin-dependent peroxiredoxin